MDPLIRRSMQLNGAVTLLFGVALIAFAGPIAVELALPGPIPLEIVGLACLGYGPALLRASRRDLASRAVLVFAAVDAGWILVSVAIAALAPMNALGRAVVLLQALVTAVFVAMELAGLRRVPAVR